MKLALTFVWVVVVVGVVQANRNQEQQDRNLVDLICDPGFLLEIDESCLLSAQEDRQNAFTVADSNFNIAIVAAETKARKRLRRADRNLRADLTEENIRKRCRKSRKFRRCARNFINKRRAQFESKRVNIIIDLEQTETDARAERKAARRSARVELREAEDGCCECVEIVEDITSFVF